MKHKCSQQIFLKKKALISDSINIRPVETELFHADRRTDGHDEANSGFSQFRKCAEKCELEKHIKFVKTKKKREDKQKKA